MFKSTVCALALVIGFSPLAQARADGVALWQLEGPSGGQATLMGTVHLLPDDDSWADKRVKAAVKAADMLVLEANMDGEDGTTFKRFAMERGFLAPGAPSLLLTIGAEDAAALQKAEAALDIPLGATARMQPWFAAMNLALASVMQQGFSAEEGAEAWLKARFAKEGEPVGGLEAPLAGLNAIASLPPDLQLEMLRAAIDQALDGGEGIEALYSAWRAGNQADLTTLLLDPAQFDPGVHDVVLAQRNKAWIAPILAYLETPEREFIAVGAAHMVGPDDLIGLLREAGVTVTRAE